MTNVVRGGFGTPSGNGSDIGNAGTEFLNVLAPPKAALDGYNGSLSVTKQIISVPQTFRDAMAVREEVYAQQGVPLEAEFDADDSRSWHWVAYASVASHSNSSDSYKQMQPVAPNTPSADARRSSATAARVPVATIRLIPPPHSLSSEGQKSDPAPEPYVKLGRLAVRNTFRGLGLSSLLINAVFEHAHRYGDRIYRPLSPTAIETAQIQGHMKEKELVWQGLFKIHAQTNLKSMWKKHGFHEELKDDDGTVFIASEPHWMEEGIEHVAMWKKLPINRNESLILDSNK